MASRPGGDRAGGDWSCARRSRWLAGPRDRGHRLRDESETGDVRAWRATVERPSAPMPPAAIEVAGLTKRFGDVTAVDGLSFAVPRGRVTGFLAPTAPARLPTMRVVLGPPNRPTERPRILGKLYAALDRPLGHVGAMLESTGFHPGRTGGDHLRIVARAGRLPMSASRPLDQVAMREYADRRVGRYSSGMRQRLGLATAPSATRMCWCWTNPATARSRRRRVASRLPACVRRRGSHRLRLEPPARRDGTDRRPARGDRPRPARPGGACRRHHVVGGPRRASCDVRREEAWPPLKPRGRRHRGGRGHRRDPGVGPAASSGSARSRRPRAWCCTSCGAVRRRRGSVPAPHRRRARMAASIPPPPEVTP